MSIQEASRVVFLSSLIAAAFCMTGGLTAADPQKTLFERVEIDAQPPDRPWIKAVDDLDGDGRPDILGANHGGPFQPVELWKNRLLAQP